jgi:hypothetical protein
MNRARVRARANIYDIMINTGVAHCHLDWRLGDRFLAILANYRSATRGTARHGHARQ